MSTNFKKILLAGTALVAASLATQAQAAGHNLTAGANATWASAGTKTGAAVASATTGDNVDITVGGVTLTVTNDQTADDGGGVNAFTLGTVTDTGGTGILAVANTNGNAMTVTIGAATVGGNASFTTVTGTAGNNVTATVTNALTVGGALTVANNNVTGAVSSSLTVGSVAVTGTTAITTANKAGATAAMTVNGTAVFKGAVSVTGNAAAGSDASLTLKGATNTFTGGLTLTTATGKANLNLTGSVAQTVTGTIAGSGFITVDNAAGVTFTDAVTATDVLIEKAAGDSAATFKNTVTSGIDLGGAGTGTNTLTFDTTTQGFTVTGVIAGAAAGETNNIVVVGGKTLTLASAATANLDSLSVTGTGTTVTTGQNLTLSVGTTVGTGATLKTTGNTVTSAITNSGTVEMGGGAITGDINGGSAGVGTLLVSSSGTLTGSAGKTTTLAAITVSDNKTLTVTAAAAARTLGATTITLDSAGTNDATLALTLGNDVTVNGAIVTGSNGKGVITGSAAAGIITFGGNVGTAAKTLKSLTLADNAAVAGVTTANNLYIDTITLGANDTLLLNGNNVAQVVSGAVNGAGAKGVITVGDSTHKANVTFGGALGGGATLQNVTVASGSTASVAKSVSTDSGGAGVIGFDNEGTFNISTSAGAVTVAEATGISKFNGTTNITGSTATVGSAVLTGGAELRLDGTLNVDLQGANAKTLTMNGTAINIGTVSGVHIDTSNAIILGAAATLGKAGTNSSLTFSKTANFDPTATAVLTDAGNITLNNNTTANPFSVAVGAGSVQFDNNAAITVVQSGGGTNLGTALTSGFITLTDTAFLDMQDNGSTATALKVKLVQRDAAAVLSNQGVGAANALLAITAAATNDIDATDKLGLIRGNLQSAATAAEADAIADAITPTVDGSATAAVMDVGTQVQGLNETRLAFLRTGESQSGMAAGSPMEGASVWAQVFGDTSSQDERDGVAGFDADTLGVALGVDSSRLLDAATVGIALNYARTDADSDNANTTDTEIDSYGFTLYGSTNALGHQVFLDGQLGYAYNDIDTTRHNVGGIAGLTALGNTNSDQYSARVAVGRDYEVQSGMTVTPVASMSYVHLATDGFTETGAGGANLAVNDSSLNVLDLGLSATVAWNLKAGSSGAVLKPSVHAGYTYDAIGDRVEVTSAFTGGGAAFATNGADPSRSEGNVGVGITLSTVENWDLSAAYDYRFRSDYDASSGYLRATTRF